MGPVHAGFLRRGENDGCETSRERGKSPGQKLGQNSEVRTVLARFAPVPRRNSDPTFFEHPKLFDAISPRGDLSKAPKKMGARAPVPGTRASKNFSIGPPRRAEIDFQSRRKSAKGRKWTHFGKIPGRRTVEHGVRSSPGPSTNSSAPRKKIPGAQRGVRGTGGSHGREGEEMNVTF